MKAEEHSLVAAKSLCPTDVGAKLDLVTPQ